MAQTSLIIGDTNWAVKEDSLLGYNVIQDNYLPIPIDCVRATTATRVNEQGLIEIVPRNLFTSSEQIDTADWVKQGVSATANQAISPNGTLTAQLLDDGTAASTQHWIFQNPSLLNGATYTISFYAKYISRKFMAVNIFNGLASQYVYYNIQDGLVSGSTGDVTASITSVGNGWFRIVYTRSMATSGSAPNFRIGFADDTLNITYTGSNKQAYVWGFQLENFPTVTEYFPTTNRLDIPRIDYSTGTASLLVEPQRTNIYPYSNQLSQWTKSGAITVTENNAISPDGTNNANRVQFTSSSDLLYLSGTGSAGSNTLTVYAKAKNGVSANFRFFANGATLFSSNQTATGTWQRFTFTYTFSAVTVGLSAATTGADDILFYGFQQEIGTYPTSYIPTIASTVTRNTDFLTRAGFGNNSTSGTLFFDIYANNILSANGFYLLQLFASSSVGSASFSDANSISFVANGPAIELYNNSYTRRLQTIIPTSKQRIKMAIRYNGTNVSSAINGTLSTVFTDTSVGVKNALRINNGESGAYSFNNVTFFPSYLSDSELQSLTTI